jgi:hypothetical protein
MVESRDVSQLAWDRLTHAGSVISRESAWASSHRGFSRSDTARAPLARWVDRLAGASDGPMGPLLRMMNSICMYVYIYIDTHTRLDITLSMNRRILIKYGENL